MLMVIIRVLPTYIENVYHPGNFGVEHVEGIAYLAITKEQRFYNFSWL